jgi:hypothetical protein
VVAGLDDPAVVQHDDLVRVADGGQAVRDGDGGAASGQGVERPSGRLAIRSWICAARAASWISASVAPGLA